MQMAANEQKKDEQKKKLLGRAIAVVATIRSRAVVDARVRWSSYGDQPVVVVQYN